MQTLKFAETENQLGFFHSQLGCLFSAVRITPEDAVETGHRIKAGYYIDSSFALFIEGYIKTLPPLDQPLRVDGEPYFTDRQSCEKFVLAVVRFYRDILAKTDFEDVLSLPDTISEDVANTWA